MLKIGDGGSLVAVPPPAPFSVSNMVLVPSATCDVSNNGGSKASVVIDRAWVEACFPAAVCDDMLDDWEYTAANKAPNSLMNPMEMQPVPESLLALSNEHLPGAFSDSARQRHLRTIR